MERDVGLSKVTLEIFTKLEQKWLAHWEADRKIRILSIDGGGTDCIAAGAGLIRLEDEIREKISDPHVRVTDFFDIVAGTGIGAILAALITADDGSGRPLFTAREAVEWIDGRKSDLFKVKVSGVLRRRRRFSSRSMDRVLQQVFRRKDGGTALTLKDTCKPLLIPCFDLKSRAPFVFSRADASESPSFDFELWKVCRATSATPGLFAPFRFSSVDEKTSCIAIDGGVVMNNPTAAAVTHVLHNKRDFPAGNGVEDLLVLSLGNGPSSSWDAVKKQPHRNSQYPTPSVVDIVLDGVSETVDQMIGNAFCWNRQDYVRIQATGLGSDGRAGPRWKREEEILEERGVESLPFGGKRLMPETNGQRIRSFAHRLIASRKCSLPPSPGKDSAVNVLTDGR